MNNTLTALSLAAVLVFTTACAGFYSAPVVPGAAFIYADTKAPMDIDADSTNLGSKTGKAKVTTILGLLSFGDASTTAAAQNGGITTVRHLDYEFKNILGIYSEFTTVAKGD